MKDDNRRKIMMQTMTAQGWDMGAAIVAQELADFLSTIKDEGSAIDSGGGNGDADLWVTIGGVEFYINIRKSNNQIAKDQPNAAE